jgi:hypothetical protein
VGDVAQRAGHPGAANDPRAAADTLMIYGGPETMLGTRRDGVVAFRSMGGRRIRLWQLACLALLLLLAGLVARAPAATAAARAFGGPLASNPFAAQSSVFASAGTPTRYEAAILADHPTLYLPLSETSGTTAFDHSKNGLDGTYDLGVTHAGPGPLLNQASSAVFSSGEVAFQSGEGLPSGAQPRTLEVWTYNTCAAYDPISYGDVEHGHGFTIRLSESHITVQAGEQSVTVPTVDGFGGTAPNCDNSGWHMIDVTYDGATVDVFDDGQLVGEGQVGELTTEVPGQGLRLSVSGDVYAYGYDQWSTKPYGLSDAAVYPSALSPAAVDAHWTTANIADSNQQCATLPSGPYSKAVLHDSPAIYLRLGEEAPGVSARIAFDSSGHCTNATNDLGAAPGEGVVEGEESSALYGSGQVAFQSGDSLPSGAQPRTLEFWAHNTCHTYDAISYGDVEHGHGFVIHVGEGRVTVEAGEQSVSAATVDGFGGTAPNCDASGWHMIDVTYDGGTVEIFQDGQSIGGGHVGELNTRVPGQGLRLAVSSDVYAYGYDQWSTKPYGVSEAALYPDTLAGGRVVAHWIAASESPEGESLIAGTATNGFGGHVQACPMAGGACRVAPNPINSAGHFHLVVPNGTYTVTAFPPAGSPSGSTTFPAITVPPAETHLATTFTEPGGLPEGVSLSSPGRGTQENKVPRVYWTEPSTYSVPGCTNGFGTLDVEATNTTTGQLDDVPTSLVETSPGSGIYSADIPPLAPLHGEGNFSPLIVCPEHSAVFPNGGTAVGGTQVLLAGSGFAGATAVSFGSTAAQSFKVINDHMIVAISPPGTSTVGVKVTSGGGSEVSVGSFSYFGVTSLDTTSGTAEGGTSVAIHGYGFGNVQSVVFGIMPAQSFTVVSPTEIDAVAPPGVGTIDVQVINGLASSDLGSPDMFSYQGGPPGSSSINEGTGPNAVQNLAAQYSGYHLAGFSFLLPLRIAGEWILRHLPGVTGDLVRGAINAIVNLCKDAGGDCVLALRALLSAALPVVADFLVAAAPVVAAILVGVGIYALLKHFCSPGGLFGLCNLFIDPSGTVVDTTGNPISAATASLLGQLSAGEPFSLVPSSSGAIEPAENPEKTGSSGQFDWNALAGTYQVEASAPGCHAPEEPAQSSVFTSPFVLPPPAVGLTLTLECVGGTAPTPKVTGLAAPSGSTAGGNLVDILGEGLASVTTVHFGPNASVHVQPLSPYAVAAVAPAGTGTVDITVSGPGGTSATGESDHYIYTAPLVTESSPVVESVTPNSGPVSGGTVATIKGRHLEGTFAVEFGGMASAQVTPVSATEVQAVAPAAAFPMRVDVAVTTSNGSSAPTLADGFIYGTPPPPLSTAVSLAASPSAPTSGQSFTVTATVAPTDGGGTVAFYADGSGTPITGCGAQALSPAGSSYQASCTIAGLPAGGHSISASYAGDASYAGSSGSTNVSIVEPKPPPGGGGGGTSTSTTSPPTRPASTAATGTVSLYGSTIIAQSSGKTAVKLSCTGTGTCSGKLTLTAKRTTGKGKTKRSKTTMIATATFSIEPGKTAPITLALNTAGRALLKADHGRLSARLTILKSFPSPASTQRKSVHLVQQKAKKKAKK